MYKLHGRCTPSSDYMFRLTSANMKLLQTLLQFAVR